MGYLSQYPSQMLRSLLSYTSCNQLVSGLIDRRGKTGPHRQLLRLLEIQIVSNLS